MSYIVTLPYDPLWPALDWAKQYCSSYITNDVHKTLEQDIGAEYQIDYYFADEKDAVWFKLRWL